MNILAVGDIVGNIGIKEFQKRLPDIKNKYEIDFIIVIRGGSINSVIVFNIFIQTLLSSLLYQKYNMF